MTAVLSAGLRTPQKDVVMSEPSLDGVRSAAVSAERIGAEAALSSVWQDLIDGRLRVSDAFFTRDRCFLVLVVPRGAVCTLSGRRRLVLEKLLSGQNGKELSFELGVALSTISQDAKLALSQLGFDRTAGRVHPLLAMSARASMSGSLSHGRAGWFGHANETYRVVGALRPDQQLGPVLPPAELAVVRGLVEGRNYKEIAESRGTSTRTVANQLAAAFRRLGVSGRCRLLDLLTRSHDTARVA